MRYILLLSVCLAMSITVWGDVPVLTFSGGEINIEGTYVSILEDSLHQLNIEEVIHSKDFKPCEQVVPNLMISGSTHWVKLDIKNETEEEELMLEYAYPIVDQADLYVLQPNGNLEFHRMGEKVPISERKYQHPNFLYDLKIPKNQSVTVFFQLRNNQQIMLPLKLGSSETIFNSISKADIFSSIYVGIIFIMALYNFFLFIAIRDKSYFYYVGYILAAGLTHISHHGYTYKLFWPSFPMLAEWSVAISPSLVGFATIFFIRDFLRTKVYTPRLHKLYNVFILTYTVCITLYFLGLEHISYQMSQSTALVISILIIATALPIMRKGYRPAKFFIIAWTVFLLSVVVFILKDFGVLPYNSLTVYCLEIGAAFELVLISFALADRINIMKKEKEESQAKTLEALQENERIMREQNVVLEAKVNERTQELQKSNSNLSTALTDLKEAQTQLVDAEKMASLGQLTAGIAHEINNPINFVVSNINPLKRDINDIMEVLNKYSEIKDEKGLNDKLKEIDSLKEDLDINYLTEEIALLLKGMDEGATRTAEIVSGLRTFSRLDESDLKKADINDGLDSTLLLLNSSLNKAEVVKQYDNLEPIECYAGKLNQLFMNVLKNAAHAVEKKIYGENEKPTITISTEDNHDEIIVSIKDNGIGMDEATKNRIFEPFFTTKDVGEGTGLGLSIAYNIIEKHNGFIEVESALGEGTEFIMSIAKQQPAEGEKDGDKIKSMKVERRNRLLKTRKSANSKL